MDSVAVGFSASARVVARKKLSIVVTGGAGFLGSHLCEHLVGQGHHVICIDNFHTGRPANVRALAASGRFEVIEHDIVRPFEHKLPRFDHIYNLACPASPPHYQADPVATALICSQGTYNCLQAAKRHSARVFHASTSEIYGDPEVHPQTEDYHGNVNTIGPRSCYDEGKRFAETLVTDFGARHGLVTRMARIFNTYGPPASHRSSAGPTPLMLVPGSSLCCDGVQRCAHAVDVDIPFHVLGRASTRSASAVQHPVETQYRCYPGSSSVPVPVRSHA